MTQLRAHQTRYTLHVSVAQRWWLHHLPLATEAERLLNEWVVRYSVRFVTLDTLLVQVLADIVADLGEDLDPFLSKALVDDVTSLFVELAESGALLTVSHRRFLRAAMLIVGRRHIPFDEALVVSLAQSYRWPLLLADRDTYDLLKPLEALEQALSVVWLSDELAP